MKYQRVSVPATSATSPFEWIPDVTSWAPKDSMQGSFSQLMRDFHEISSNSPGDADDRTVSDDDLSARDRREVPEAPAAEQKLGKRAMNHVGARHAAIQTTRNYARNESRFACRQMIGSCCAIEPPRAECPQQRMSRSWCGRTYAS